MADKKPSVRVTLPAGKARWPQLDEAKEFKKGDGKPKFSIGVWFDDAAQKAIDKIIKDAWAQLAPPEYAKKMKEGVTPIKTPEKGEPYFKASTGAKYKPPVFDSKVRKLPEGIKVGGGSEVKIDVTLVWFKEAPRNWGLTAYLNAVQVLKLEEDTWGKPNFAEEEGYEVSAEDGGGFKPENTEGMADF